MDIPVDYSRPRRVAFETDEIPPLAVFDDDVSRGTSVVIDPLPRPLRTRTLVVANQKGGVGKTTSAVNVAVALADGGLEVLVIDLDPQGNASTALGIDHRDGTGGTYEVLLEGAAIADLAQVSPESTRLKVLPATLDLAGAELELVNSVGRERQLQRALAAYCESRDVDYIMMDCPPSLGLLTVNALVAATEIFVPIQCEYYALEGVTQLLRTIEMVRGNLNDELHLSTVLLTMFDGRTKLSQQVAEEVRSHFSRETLRTAIPRSVRVSEAPSYQTTVLNYDPRSAGAQAYREAAREIAERGAKPEEY